MNEPKKTSKKTTKKDAPAPEPAKDTGSHPDAAAATEHTGKGKSQQRKHPRVPLNLLVQLRSSSVEDFRASHGANLSIGGMFITTRDRRPVGSQVFFQFTLRDGGTLIEGLGRVVHVSDDGMGLEFISVLEPSAGIIRALVAERLAHHG